MNDCALFVSHASCSPVFLFVLAKNRVLERQTCSFRMETTERGLLDTDHLQEQHIERLRQERGCRQQMKCPKTPCGRLWLAARIVVFLIVSSFSIVGYFGNRALIDDLQSRLGDANAQVIGLKTSLGQLNNSLVSSQATLFGLQNTLDAVKTAAVQTNASLVAISEFVQTLNVTELANQVIRLQTDTTDLLAQFTAWNTTLASSFTTALQATESWMAVVGNLNQSVQAELMTETIRIQAVVNSSLASAQESLATAAIEWQSIVTDTLSSVNATWMSWQLAMFNMTMSIANLQTRVNAWHSAFVNVNADACIVRTSFPSWWLNCTYLGTGSYQASFRAGAFSNTVHLWVTPERVSYTSCALSTSTSTVGTIVSCASDASFWILAYGF